MRDLSTQPRSLTDRYILSELRRNRLESNVITVVNVRAGGFRGETLQEQIIFSVIPDDDKCLATTLSNALPGRIKARIIPFKVCLNERQGFPLSSEPQKSPSDRYILLRPDKKPDKELTMDDFTEVKHPRVQLVFLSACSMMEILAEHLTGEVIRVVHAFQLAWYLHVVGTLWKAENKTIPGACSKNLLGGDSKSASQFSLSFTSGDSVADVRLLAQGRLLRGR
ncbi:hypothetical protein TWF718_006526 [Orbilia javanica]|uniref:CHAT domain-containing protein n=1 Tax=Orbilia javanica TaxID=47235 RepID=A0AAN8MTL9_9PEZI